MSLFSALAQDRPGFLEQTGVPPEELARYLPSFTEACKPVTDSDPLNRLEPEAPLEDRLLFIWLHTRMRMPRTYLAALFGLSTGEVDAWIERLAPIFQQAIRALSTTALPERDLDVLRRFNEHAVRYLIVGGHAVAHHGYLRPILDLDLFIATDAQNAERLTLALEDLAPGVDPRVSGLLQLSARVIRLGTPPYSVEPVDPNSRFIDVGRPPASIEILTTLSAVTFEDCAAARVVGRLGDVSAPIIGIEHLRINKRASIRPKDADDLAHLS